MLRTLSNIRRLWAGMRRGEHMTCHPTDPHNPVIEKALAKGIQPAPESARTIQCIGAVILQQREWMVFQDVYGGNLARYRREHKDDTSYLKEVQPESARPE